jgi:hypothetical protein
LKIRDIYTRTAEETLEFRNPLRKEWMSKEIWKKTEERRDVKRKLPTCKTRSKTEELQREYNNRAKEVKRSILAVRRKCTSDLAEKAQRAINENDLKEVYQIT